MIGEPLFGELNPGLVLIIGALLVPVLPGLVRSSYMLALPVVAFIHVLGLPIGELGQLQLFDMTLVTTRVDKLSLIFGYIFLLATLLGVIYALHVGDRVQHATGLIYAGSAIGAAFAGDLITLFVFWEMTAIASVFLIWAARTDRAYNSGQRYLIVQVGSGVILLVGILMYFRETGSIAFGPIGIESLAGQIILVAFGIKCAFPLLHSWLQDSYPEATPSGTVMLSAFTTKLAVYALARGYAGTDILIPIGATMAIFPLIYAAVENDVRRVLAHCLNNQLGFMVVGVGIGTELAINGTAAHAFCHILYKALLFMAMGAVLFRAGTSKATELGGLARAMPWTLAFCLIGAASISFPLFSGFVAKSLIISAALKGGHFWAWIILVAASAGVFLVCGLRLPYVVFFAGGRKPTADGSVPAVKEAPLNMLIAMGLASAFCVGIGVAYSGLYDLLPYPVKYDPYTLDHIVTQLQLLAFTGLAFALALQFSFLPRNQAATLIDAEWLYRKFGYNIGVTLMLLGQQAWYSVSGGIAKQADAAEQWLADNHSTDSVIGRTWPTGTMAFWAVVMLGGYLVLFYIQ